MGMICNCLKFYGVLSLICLGDPDNSHAFLRFCLVPEKVKGKLGVCFAAWFAREGRF
jgi:hypothetical protein